MAKIAVYLARFGARIQLIYEAGPTPDDSPPTASIFLNDLPCGVVRVVSEESEKWGSILLDVPENFELLTPKHIGFPEEGATFEDYEALEQIEAYLWGQLTTRLETALQSLTPREGETEEQKDAHLSLTPHERAVRLAVQYEDLGRLSAPLHLVQLVSNEIYDVVDRIGEALAEAIDREHPEDAAEFVRLMISQALDSWTGEESDE